MTLRTSATRPRQQWLALVVGILVLLVGVATVVLADTGTHDITVPDSGTSATADLGDATVEYIGSSASNQASGTGLFDPFLRLQGSPTEKGYNTCSQSSCGGNVTQFETKTGSWTKAILASAIPVVDCGGDLAGTSCWELFVDINDGNNAKRISLNEVEVWLTTNARLTGYVDPTGFPSGATQIYDFSGAILINDVNQGSGRGDLRYLIPVQPFAAGDFFVLYSKWGTTSGTAGNFGTGGYASEGGFEEWKVRKAPNVTILKTANPPGPVNAGDTIGFDITVSNTGAAGATDVMITDPLPASDGLTTGTLNWSENPDNSNCAITGSIGSQVLDCTFATLASGASVTIHIQSATTAADCGIVSNTAILVGDGSSTATVTVNCAAIRILKNSTKGGAVANAGAVFSVDGPDLNTDPDFSVTDDAIATAPDEDADIGEVCVSGLAPGNYTINETAAPSGYGDATETDVLAVAAVGTNCTDNQPTATDTATFTNAPLYDLQVNFRDGGSGETSATISCTNTGTADTTPATGWDTSSTFLDESAPETVVCTIVVDP
jgi:uncharacterized repeat protein (TIGR01451 family)